MAENIAYADLLRRSEITKDVRFHASSRLKQRHRISSFVISLLSLLVIAISLVPNLSELDEYQSQLLLTTTIINSVFIIITSLIERSSNIYNKAEFLHKNANEINAVFLKLKQLTKDEIDDGDTIGKFQDEYQKVLLDCPYNHESMDHMIVRATKPKLFDNWFFQKGALFVLERFALKLRYLVYKYSWLSLHGVVVIASIWVINRVVG